MGIGVGVDVGVEAGAESPLGVLGGKVLGLGEEVGNGIGVGVGVGVGLGLGTGPGGLGALGGAGFRPVSKRAVEPLGPVIGLFIPGQCPRSPFGEQASNKIAKDSSVASLASMQASAVA